MKCKHCETWTKWIIFVICFVGIVLYMAKIRADEYETKSRTGDIIPVIVFCSSPKAAELFVTTEIKDMEKTLSEAGEACIVPKRSSPGPFGLARLSKWESGPHIYQDKSHSVWRIENSLGMHAWTPMPDDMGAHIIQSPI